VKPLVHDNWFDLIFTPSTLIKSSIYATALIELKVILDQRNKIDSIENLITDFEKTLEDILERDDTSDDIKHKIKSMLDKKDSIKRRD